MRSAIFALLLVPSLPGSLFAQVEGRAVPAGGVVSEGFDPTARVAGSRVVGVRFGPVEGRTFDPGEVRIAGASPDSTICIRAISRDGLYWMRTPYEPGVGATLLLSPFTQVPDRLRRYRADEIAIYAFETPATSDNPSAESRVEDCLSARDDTLRILPVLSAPDTDDTLQVLVNSGNRRVSGRLTGANEVPVTCAAPASTERIAYDRVCSAKIGPAALGAGPVTLELVLDDGLARTRLSYAIRLTGGGP